MSRPLHPTTLGELKALRKALSPFVVRAADRTGVTFDEAPPFEEGDCRYSEVDYDTLVQFLRVCVEIERMEWSPDA